MKFRNAILYPILTAGKIILFFGILGFVAHFYSLNDSEYTNDFRIFVLVCSFSHVFIGLTILLRTKIGYYSFKFFLYVYLLGFPFGTYISLKFLNYMKTQNIKQYFK